MTEIKKNRRCDAMHLGTLIYLKWMPNSFNLCLKTVFGFHFALTRNCSANKGLVF